MTKTISHRGNKVEDMSCEGCSEHKMHEQLVGSLGRAPLRLQGGSRVLDDVNLRRQAR